MYMHHVARRGRVIPSGTGITDGWELPALELCSGKLPLERSRLKAVILRRSMSWWLRTRSRSQWVRIAPSCCRRSLMSAGPMNPPIGPLRMESWRDCLPLKTPWTKSCKRDKLDMCPSHWSAASTYCWVQKSLFSLGCFFFLPFFFLRWDLTKKPLQAWSLLCRAGWPKLPVLPPECWD